MESCCGKRPALATEVRPRSLERMANAPPYLQPSHSASSGDGWPGTPQLHEPNIWDLVVETQMIW